MWGEPSSAGKDRLVIEWSAPMRTMACVPEISRFFGIVIRMNYDDHEPPHFHAEYAGSRAAIDIDSLSVLRGELPGRVLGLVIEWAVMHQAELESDWELARRQLPPHKIAPLG